MTQLNKFAGAMLAISLIGFAAFADEPETKKEIELKPGKITAMSLDTTTNKMTVTVTLGTLNLPDKAEMEKGPKGKMDKKETNGPEKGEKPEMPEIITLGSETVTFELDEKVKIQPFDMRRLAKELDKETSDEKAGPEGREGPKMGMMPPEGGRPGPMGGHEKMGREGKGPEMPSLKQQLSVGGLVNLVTGEDGKVSALELANPLPPKGMMARGPREEGPGKGFSNRGPEMRSDFDRDCPCF